MTDLEIDRISLACIFKKVCINNEMILAAYVGRRLMRLSIYSLSSLILANIKEPPDTHQIISKNNAFGFKLLSTHSVLKQSFSFLQQKYNILPHCH